MAFLSFPLLSPSGTESKLVEAMQVSMTNLCQDTADVLMEPLADGMPAKSLQDAVPATLPLVLTHPGSDMLEDDDPMDALRIARQWH